MGQRLRGSLEFDGFIGDSRYDNEDDYDLSGELISIEETYKEMAMYRKSATSNDQLTNSVLNSDRSAKADEKASLYSVQRPPLADGQSHEESDKLKRSMTVILEEELEDSHMNLTHHLGASVASKLAGKRPKINSNLSFNKSQ